LTGANWVALKVVQMADWTADSKAAAALVWSVASRVLPLLAVLAESKVGLWVVRWAARKAAMLAEWADWTVVAMAAQFALRSVVTSGASKVDPKVVHLAARKVVMLVVWVD